MDSASPPHGPVKFRCFDLETTAVNTDEAKVVQAAVVEAPVCVDGIDLANAVSHSQLFAAQDVPAESTKVHRITDRNPERFDFDVQVIPDDAPPFEACVQSMVSALTEDGVVSVSFNGCGYDIPIVARYAAAVLGAGFVTQAERDAAGVGREAIETRLRRRHIDVMRLWLRARAECLTMTAQGVGDGCSLDLTADMFAGSLTAAHGFYVGRAFDDAHDAGVDCRATLAVLDEMLRSGFVDVETAIAWSNLPLPGDVDFDGKFKWEGDQAVIKFGKHAGTPLEGLPASYVQWILGADFPASTKALLRRFKQGEYPAREYESE